jgi:hypothetical protein
MTSNYEKRLNAPERLRAIRMRAAELRETLARMQRAEATADSALRRAKLVWAEFKNRSRRSQQLIDYDKR